jgi:hypothetical protein
MPPSAVLCQSTAVANFKYPFTTCEVSWWIIARLVDSPRGLVGPSDPAQEHTDDGGQQLVQPIFANFVVHPLDVN